MYESSLFFGLLGIALGFGSIVFVRLFFPRLGLLDFPDRYGLVRPRLPYPGGLILSLFALGIGFIAQSFFALIFPLLLLLFVSFWDDRSPLPAIVRLFVHVAVIVWVIFLGVRIDYIGDPFHNTNIALDLYPALSFGLTLVWLLALQQSMNFFDGLPGLSVGVSGIGFGTIGALGLIRPELFFDPAHSHLTFSALYLAGLCLGAWFAYWRRWIILGDSGSQVLGLLLGIISLASGAKIATTLLVLAIPLLDAFIVIGRRIFIDKKSPFHGDTRHFHHNIAHKMGEKNATILLLILSLFLGIGGITSSAQKKLLWLLGAFFVLLVLNVWAYYKAHKS